MKKIFTALAVALILIAGNLSEAAEITREQSDKIIRDFQKTAYNSTLAIDTESFMTQFNWYIVPIVQDGLDKDDISEVEHLFIIDNCETLNADGGNIYSKIFGYRGAMLVCMSSGEDEHDPLKAVNFCYATPKTKEESIYTIWLLKAFVGSISTDIDVQNLMSELTAENSSGSVIKGGVKFSIAEDGDLNILTASAQ